MEDPNLIDKLNKTAKSFFTNGSTWPLHIFGWEYDRRVLDGKDLGWGIELWISKGDKLCDMTTLETAYNTVITSIGQNWKKSEFKEYPTITHTQSEEDYVLLIKTKKILKKEYALIKELECALGLSESLFCHNSWQDPESSVIYLWIKKSCLETTLKALNITLS